MGSVTVGDATVKRAGMERSVNTLAPAHCPLRKASRSARAAQPCPAPEGVSVISWGHSLLPDFEI